MATRLLTITTPIKTPCTSMNSQYLLHRLNIIMAKTYDTAAGRITYIVLASGLGKSQPWEAVYIYVYTYPSAKTIIQWSTKHAGEELQKGRERANPSYVSWGFTTQLVR
jgi:hypothetical protein